MKQIDLIRGYTDVQKMAEFLYDIAQEKKSVKEIRAYLEEELPEDPGGGQKILESIDKSDYPWSFPEPIRDPLNDCSNNNHLDLDT